MKTIIGTSNKYLTINVTTREWQVYSFSEKDSKDYLGGKGIALKYFYDRLGNCLNDVDPLGPDNILCFTTGVLIGTGAPCSARFSGVTKSPLTGIMTTCSCGGPFGMSLKTAGYDGIFISGASPEPVNILIDEYGVKFENAADVWGMTTHHVQENLCKNKKDAALVVGPAGENLVLYANICSGHRFLGRGGMGAVMGSKRIKAIVARGFSHKIIPADSDRFIKANAKAKKYLLRNGFTKNYAKYGTNYGVNAGVDVGYAPVHNFRDRTDERCRNLSGEAMADRYHTEHSTCTPCTVLCGHKGTYPDGVKRPIPEYETIGLWGGNLDNYDPDTVGSWNVLLNDFGIDTISCGVTVGWAMEAAEKNLRPSELAFGKTDNIAAMIENIAYRRGEGEELGLGSKRLSEKYGGVDFAIHVKGMEMAAYDPRAAWGQALNYAVANRGGCHLNAYPVALEVFFGFLIPYTTVSKALWVDFLENLYSAINSTHTCLFTGFGYLLEPPIAKYTPSFLLKFFMTWTAPIAKLFLDWSAISDVTGAVLGWNLSKGEYFKIGRRVHVLERHMNVLMGITSADDKLPGRFINEANTKHSVKKAVNLEPMIKAYYKIKGYDNNGAPTTKLLRKLGIVTNMGNN